MTLPRSPSATPTPARSADPDTLMVQELIAGGGEAQLSYAALCRDGVPLAAVTARRTRQYPAEFGRASTFVETIECPEIVEPSLACCASCAIAA